MNIKTRIAILFSVIVGLILLLFSVVIYLFSSQYREEQLFSRLKDKSLTTAKLLFEVEQVDSVLLNIIARADQTLLYNEKVVIFNEAGKKIYDSKANLPLLLTTEQLRKVWEKDEERFTINKNEIIGLEFTENNQNYIIVASAFDKFGYSKIQNLAQILLVCLLISVSLLVITGRFFAKRLLIPINNIIRQVEDINISSLSNRVYGGRGKDEITQLANSFNSMLERLEAAFEIQHDFVSHASHELRTPLTAIIGQIDVALLKERNREEYMGVLKSIREDLDNFVDLTNKLLLLAQTNSKLPVLPILEFRVDEVLWQARAELIRRRQDYQIDIEFKREFEDDAALIYYGSQQLMRIAFLNLMDNACKFSVKRQAEVVVDVIGDSISIDFINETQGIDIQEINSIFDPFYRAPNSRGISGHGIGLSLVKNIITIHHSEALVHMPESNKIIFSIRLKSNKGFGRTTQR